MTRDDHRRRIDPRVASLSGAVGLASGTMSGLFGIGGGIVIVPLLVLWLGQDQRRAAGTSLAAIVPTAVIGVVSYGLNDAVAWVPGLLIACGSIVGALAGTRLLPRVPLGVLRWGFIGFLLASIVAIYLVIPPRDAQIALTWQVGAGLIGLGLFAGLMSGLLGVGGGSIVVPALTVVFGAGDLLARGTSLLMMVPAAVAGTVSNVRRGNVDGPVAAIVGVTACVGAPLGVWLATQVTPTTGTVLLSILLAVVTVQMAVRAVRLRGH